jgi:hypothetical protein
MTPAAWRPQPVHERRWHTGQGVSRHMFLLLVSFSGRRGLGRGCWGGAAAERARESKYKCDQPVRAGSGPAAVADVIQMGSVSWKKGLRKVSWREPKCPWQQGASVRADGCCREVTSYKLASLPEKGALVRDFLIGSSALGRQLLLPPRSSARTVAGTRRARRTRLRSSSSLSVFATLTLCLAHAVSLAPPACATKCAAVPAARRRGPAAASTRPPPWPGCPRTVCARASPSRPTARAAATCSDTVTCAYSRACVHTAAAMGHVQSPASNPNIIHKRHAHSRLPPVPSTRMIILSDQGR